MDHQRPDGPGPQRRTSALLLSGALVLVLVSGAAGYLLHRGGPAATSISAVATSGGSAPATLDPGTDASPDTGGVTSSAVQGFGSFTNPRFGFRTLYPADFTPQTQSANGDGMEWVGGTEGTATVAAFGTNNDGATPDDELETLSIGLDVTYSRITDDVVTVSGFKDADTVVYVREVVGAGSTATLEWSYPAADKDRWDGVVAVTAAAFRPGDLSTSH